MRGPSPNRGVFRKFSRQEDVERELNSHLELCVEELIAAGWSPEEARAEALRRFGDKTRIARECDVISKRHDKEVRKGMTMDAIFQDLRYAWRGLRKSPGFALVAILTLAVGIGANATVFSLVNGVLLKPLPYEAPEELVWVAERSQGGSSNWVAWPNFRDWRAESRSFKGLAAFSSYPTTILGGTEPAYRTIATISRDFWTVFPVNPTAGRLTTPEDHREGVSPVAVVSESFAREFLGGQDALGRMVEILGSRYEVVGVIPAGFSFPSETMLWIPAELTRPSESRSAHNWKVVGRLRDGVSVQDAFSELDPLTRRLVATATDEDGQEYLATGAFVTSLREELVGDTRGPLFLLLGAAAFVLLVACTNLASALLARGTGRAREMAVRSSLGASRARIVRQLLSEAALLAIFGATAGLGFTLAALHVIRVMGSTSIPRLDVVGVDNHVLLFTAGATLLTTLIFGLFPAFRTLENDQAGTLRSEGRGNDGYKGRVWNTLVASEVAMAVVLLVGAGLLIRSFSAVLSVDGGFDGSDVAVSTVALSGIKYPEYGDHARFWDQMLKRAQEIPGVSAAGIISTLPVSGFAPNGLVHLDGDVSRHGDAIYIVASQGVFDALDITLLQGRTFNESDGPDAPHVVLVSRSFADRYWPGESPLGKQVSGGGMDNFWRADPPVFGTVVGVVADVRFRDLTRPGTPTVYWNYRQRPARIRYGANLVVESGSGDPGLVAAGLREAIREEDPDVAVKVTYLADRVSNSLAERRFILAVLSGFAGLALFLAALGIYGVVSYAVAQRTREMGIRLALGATIGGVRTMVIRQAMVTVVLGLAVGAAGAWGMTRVLSGFLYSVEPRDPATFLGAMAILLVMGLAASWLPARRGTRVDPASAMRVE